MLLNCLELDSDLEYSFTGTTTEYVRLVQDSSNDVNWSKELSFTDRKQPGGKRAAGL